MYDEETLQAFFHTESSPWWEVDESNNLFPGRLLRAFVPHTNLIPQVLIPDSRGNDPTQHQKVHYRIEDFSTASPPKRPKLPTAGTHNHPQENLFVYRAKKRPVLVISTGGATVPKAMRPSSKPKWQTSPTILVAPYYGSEQTGLRAGWHGALVERIQKCEYPQYM